MIASSIGKIFLNEFNRRKNTSYSAKDLFEKEFYPLFFDHPKHMLWVHNSPFFQLREKDNPEKRSESLLILQKRIAAKDIDGSVAVGYFSQKVTATTSGQVTDLTFPLDEEEIYSSWIGAGFAVAIEGGLSIYFFEVHLLWIIYEGWQKYRSFLSEYDHLQPTQIDRWNGQWITHQLKEKGEDLFNPMIPKKDGGMEVSKVGWINILFALAQGIVNQSTTGYVFRLDKINTTVGFIQFYLKDISRFIDIYLTIFGEEDYRRNQRTIQSLLGTAFTFLRACEMGVIGVRAMEPKDLRPYITDQRKKTKMPDYSKADEKQQISFKTYQTWLLAMLDNKQLWDKAGEAAKAYLKYETEAKAITTKYEREVQNILDSPSKRKFIEANIPVIEKAQNASSGINDLVEEINGMPEDSFRYFLTLIKFRYKFFESQNKKEAVL